MSETSLPGQPFSWWQRRVVAPLVSQLKQGLTPSRLALGLAVGGVIAVNPFLGTTTVGCLVAGVVLRLNQPVLQIANIVGAPFQLALMLPWVRAGEWLYRAAPVSFNPAVLADDFSAGPRLFFERFGATAFHAGSAWLLAAPLLGAVLYFVLEPVLRVFGRRWVKRSDH